MARYYHDEANNNLAMSNKLNSTAGYKPETTSRGTVIVPNAPQAAKPQFKYCGKSEDYEILWLKDTSNGEKPRMKGTRQEFVIVLEDSRIPCSFECPLDVIEYAKSRIAVHGRSTATGVARIYWVTESGKEIDAVKITKTVKIRWRAIED